MKKLYKQLLLETPKLRNTIYSVLYNYDRMLGKKSNTIILCYHGIGDNSWRYGISFSEFKKQIAFLKKQKYTFVSLSQLADYIQHGKTLPQHSVIISIDDGYKELISTVEYFNSQMISPALFLLANPKNANRQQLANDKTFLNAKDILYLKKNGWEFGSHSATHSDLSALSKKELNDEIIKSKSDLEKQTKSPIYAFAYPRGKYNKTVLQLTKKAGYTIGLSMEDDVLTSKTNPLLIPRIGIDRTHSMHEFPMLFSPSVIQFRKMIKQSFLGKYL